MLQDFKLFRTIDLLSFGALALVPTGSLIYMLTYGVHGLPITLMTVVTLAFFIIFALFMYHRSVLIRKITFVAKQEVAIIANEFTVDKTEIEALIEETIARWDAACGKNISRDAIKGLWVEFKPYPVTQDSITKKLAGYLVGSSAVVGWKPILKNTAFQHEVGHLIHFALTGGWDNDGCHEFMKAHNLL